MSSLTKYILRQAAGPIIMFTVVLTVLVWLTQSLQMLDLLINRQQSAGTYAAMTIYVMPSLLTIILPFALFCACLYTLNRLSGDSELIVMSSAGVSPWAMAKPMLIIGGIATVINLLLNLYLMPAGYRQMKDKVYEIINVSGLEADDPMFLILALTGQMRVFLEAAPAELSELLLY